MPVPGFRPHPNELDKWEKDYADMQKYMIGANPPGFGPMMEKLIIPGAAEILLRKSIGPIATFGSSTNIR